MSCCRSRSRGICYPCSGRSRIQPEQCCPLPSGAIGAFRKEAFASLAGWTTFQDNNGGTASAAAGIATLSTNAGPNPGLSTIQIRKSPQFVDPSTEDFCMCMSVAVSGQASMILGVGLAPPPPFAPASVSLFVQTNGIVTNVQVFVIDLASVAFISAPVGVAPFDAEHDYKLCWDAATMTGTLEIDGVAAPAATLVAAGASLASPAFSESFLVASQSGFSGTLAAGPYCIRKAVTAPPPGEFLTAAATEGVPVATLLADLLAG